MEYTKLKMIGICSICVVAFMIYLSSRHLVFIKNSADNRENIINPSRLPLCDNILTNITDGKWVRRFDLVDNKLERQRLKLKEEELDRLLAEYRINRGIHTRLWRDDEQCGYKNFQTKPTGNEWGGPVGAWCDAKSQKPCCNDKLRGVCGNVCDCENCVDTRTIYHAEVSEWIPSDVRCRSRNYTSRQACKAMENIKEIRFIGDSFMRKMQRGLVILLRNDPEYGTLIKEFDERKIIFCTGFNQFLWTDCNFGSGGLPNLLINDSPFCERHTPHIEYNSFYKSSRGVNFLNLVKKLAGKNNTFIFLGVGVHDNCNASIIQDSFFSPSLQYLKEHRKILNLTLIWPHIVFVYPDTPGLMKSSKYENMNGKDKCDIFASEMKTYCDRNNIPVLDFSKLTTGVHSYDGSHHGMGVNIMKAQLMLNYLDFMID